MGYLSCFGALARHSDPRGPLQSRRIKTLRKLGKLRRETEAHVDMLTGTGSFAGVTPATAAAAASGKGRKATRDIIADYVDYGSSVYAPLRREGRHVDRVRSAVRLDAEALAAVETASLAQISQVRAYVCACVRASCPICGSCGQRRRFMPVTPIHLPPIVRRSTRASWLRP